MLELRAVALAAIFLWLAALPLSAQSIEDKVKVCTACHGDKGLPTRPDAPIIWGQHAGYLYIELRDFKTGSRKSNVMQPIVANIEKSDLLAIARYFEAKPWPATGYRSSDADKAAGARIATSGMCTQCHLGGFLGAGTVPRTGGQTETYLHKTLLDFKTRVRGNNPDKSTLLASYSDDDLAAMARYLAGQ